MQTIKQKPALVILFYLSNFLLIHAQPSLKTTVDKNAMLIGSQVKLKVEASFQPDGYFVRWITVPDTLQHFELVEKSRIDSIFIGQKLTGLAQTFTLTSFDSGKWTVPSFNVKFKPARADTTLNFFSDSLPVSIVFQNDTGTTLRDIKPIREVKQEKPFNWYWVVGVTVLLLLILLLARLFLRTKKDKQFSPAASSLPPFRHAMNELEKLQQFHLSEPAQIKTYHFRLAAIIKQYLSGKTGTDYGSKTTGDIIILLKENNADKEQVLKTAAALRCADVVKFAKYLPDQQESETSFQSIKQMIETIERSRLTNKQ